MEDGRTDHFNAEGSRGDRPLFSSDSFRVIRFYIGANPSHPRGANGDGDIREQTRQVFANLEAVLKAAGASFADVVKATVFSGYE